MEALLLFMTFSAKDLYEGWVHTKQEVGMGFLFHNY